MTPEARRPSILWTNECDPRTSTDFCNISSNLDILEEFYSVIDSLNGKITYSVQYSESDLKSYDLVIVDFCSSAGSNDINDFIVSIKRYIEIGGSVLVTGDNFCAFTAQRATELTKYFGITFTADKEETNHWAEPISAHPIAENVNKLFLFSHAYLNVISPAKSVFEINGQSVVATYEGEGKIVAISDSTFEWGVDFKSEIASSDNFILWKNIIMWLME